MICVIRMIGRRVVGTVADVVVAAIVVVVTTTSLSVTTMSLVAVAANKSYSVIATVVSK